MSEIRDEPPGVPLSRDASPLSASGHVHRRSLLIVVESRALRDACHDAFVTAGYAVITTDAGHSAIAFLKETADPPDLALVDTELRDITAFDVAMEAYSRSIRVIPISSCLYHNRGEVSTGFDVDTLVRRVQAAFTCLQRP